MNAPLLYSFQWALPKKGIKRIPSSHAIYWQKNIGQTHDLNSKFFGIWLVFGCMLPIFSIIRYTQYIYILFYIHTIFSWCNWIDGSGSGFLDLNMYIYILFHG